ncbi:hypothetical protein M8C21_029081, partial [Ambrosia artemisiifolia]
WGHRVHHHHRRHRNSPPTHSSDEQNHTNDVVLPKQNNNSTIIIHDDVVITSGDGDVKPWNLRPRKLLIDPVDGNGNSNSNDDYVKKKRLWISLSKEEIEEDVYAFTGSKPVRRPKKRNKTAQKHVDNVFPGLYLVGVSADSYRV